MAIDQAWHLKVSCVSLKLQKDALLNLNLNETFGKLKIKGLVKVVCSLLRHYPSN